MNTHEIISSELSAEKVLRVRRKDGDNQRKKCLLHFISLTIMLS